MATLSPPPPGPAQRGRLVRVFELEPDLLEGVDASAAERLTLHGLARAVVVETGPWSPPAASAPGALGLLVLDGLVTRCTRVAGHESPELLGAGDLLRPWDPPGPVPSASPASVSWRVLAPLTVAVLDRRFARVVCTAPPVVAALLARSTARSRSLAFHLAIAHVRHADTRLELLLWHLAERWGRVTPQGIVLALPITHELLAHLTGMRRPTASTALQELIRSGRITCEGRGTWLLHGPAPEAAPLSAA